MSAAASDTWSSIRSGVSAGLDVMNHLSSADIVQIDWQKFDVHRECCSSDLGGSSLGSLSDFSKVAQDPPSSGSEAQEKRLPNVADWKGTLDLITGMPDLAEDQRNDLKQQTVAQQRVLEDLKRELHETQQRLRASEQRADELQAQADARLQKTRDDLDVQVEGARAETEARVRVICARTAGLIRANQERVRAAELRAQRAASWLQQIDAAAKNLLLNGHMNRTNS